MAYLIAAFGLLILGLSAWGLVRPEKLMALVKGMEDKPFVLMAVSSRVILGVILWFSATLSRHPLVFQVLAVVALIAAFTMLVAGKARLMRMVDWWIDRGTTVQRFWLLLGMLFGGYLLWAIWPALGVP